MVYKRFGKRLFDVVISGLGLVILSPVFLLIAFSVWRRLGRPIFFSQVRPGYKAKPFKMLKFRSMKHETNDQGELLPDAERVTPFGQWLRSTSLDELPELFNVLIGQMSMVGPRPLLMSYVPLYSIDQFRRHEVKPGITGLAQVEGRNQLSWPKRLALDVEYLNKVSFVLDMKILLKTVRKVILKEGIVSDGFVSSAPFQGETKDET
jgi:lipopolysaccharide/colanic/teichoic acid biosynthesis glycosyltransferase